VLLQPGGKKYRLQFHFFLTKLTPPAYFSIFGKVRVLHTNTYKQGENGPLQAARRFPRSAIFIRDITANYQ
jgi:hypothetical protein